MELQVTNKKDNLWTGRSVGELDAEVKKAIAGESARDPNAGGMRLKDVRDDIIKLAINDVLTQKSR